MFVIANLLNSLALVFHYILQIYMWVIIIRAILSWVNPDPYNPIVSFLYQITEPVLYRVRRFIPFHMGGIDISPIIVFIIIIFLDNFLVGTLQEIAMRLK